MGWRRGGVEVRKREGEKERRMREVEEVGEPGGEEHRGGEEKE